MVVDLLDQELHDARLLLREQLLPNGVEQRQGLLQIILIDKRSLDSNDLLPDLGLPTFGRLCSVLYVGQAVCQSLTFEIAVRYVRDQTALLASQTMEFTFQAPLFGQQRFHVAAMLLADGLEGVASDGSLPISRMRSTTNFSTSPAGTDFHGQLFHPRFCSLEQT